MVRRQETVNFMTPTPRRGNFGIKRLKLMYIVFLKKSFSEFPGMVQTNKVYSNKKHIDASVKERPQTLLVPSEEICKRF